LERSVAAGPGDPACRSYRPGPSVARAPPAPCQPDRQPLQAYCPV